MVWNFPLVLMVKHWFEQKLTWSLLFPIMFWWGGHFNQWNKPKPNSHWHNSNILCFADLDALIVQSMKMVVDDFGRSVWKCDVCNRTNKNKINIKNHVETHFQGFEHHCHLCGKQSKSRDAMRKHMSTYHK